MGHFQHTPGPWAFDADDFTEVYSEDSAALVCKVLEADDFLFLEEGTHGDVQDECLANARLIAAAPDLLDATEALIVALFNPTADDAPSVSDAASMAAAAIRKATGEISP